MADTSADALPGADAWPGAGVPGDRRSALLVAVPEAEPAVAEHRARLDSSARDGVPAHLTVLYPFLPPASIDRAVLASLRGLFAGFAPFGAGTRGTCRGCPYHPRRAGGFIRRG